MIENIAYALLLLNFPSLFAYWKYVNPKTEKYIKFKKDALSKKVKEVTNFSGLADSFKDYDKIKKLEGKFREISLYIMLSTILAIVTLFLRYLSSFIAYLREILVAEVSCFASAFLFVIAFGLTFFHMCELHKWELTSSLEK